MNEPQKSSWADVGGVFYLVAFVIAIGSGYRRQFAPFGIGFSALVFTIGYAMIRASFLAQIYREDGLRVVRLYLYLLVGFAVLSSVLHGLGRLVS